MRETTNCVSTGEREPSLASANAPLDGRALHAGRSCNARLIWNWDVQTNHLAWNDALCTRFGYDRDEVKPSLQWGIDHIHPEDRHRVGAHVREIVEHGGWCGHVRLV